MADFGPILLYKVQLAGCGWSCCYVTHDAGASVAAVILAAALATFFRIFRCWVGRLDTAN
ncbi:hypothetical protein AMQ83_12110 [Paenibacillus riograndensis]|nr:hypothetical protein AMQ83_12110 [Paenibacillus riograndensis]